MFDEIVITEDFVNGYLNIIEDMPMPGIEERAENIARVIKRDLKIIALEEACEIFVRMHHMGQGPFYTCDCRGCKAFSAAMRMKV